MRKTIKYILYLLFLGMLCVPLVQMMFTLTEVEPLKGAVEVTEKPTFKLEDWFDGEYQNDFEHYVNDSIGYRPWFVRLHNQLRFSIFKKPQAKGVVVGKENYLYEVNYVKAYNGEDFIGTEKVKEQVGRIKTLQDKLAALNKTLIVCLAPSKGMYYPEYFPKSEIKPKTDSTNYKRYQQLLAQEAVNHIDMNKWFLEMQDTSDCILFPKYGIHWSYYGMLLSADSLISYIENKRNITMPHIEFTKINHSTEPKYTDYDIAEGMNLMYKMESDTMCYPELSFTKTDEAEQPKTLVISDSFYWGMFNTGMGSTVFSLGGFWYYNEQIYPDTYESPITVGEVDIAQRVLDNDVVILMSTDANLSNFSWGFVENVLEALSDREAK